MAKMSLAPLILSQKNLGNQSLCNAQKEDGEKKGIVVPLFDLTGFKVLEIFIW